MNRIEREDNRCKNVSLWLTKKEYDFISQLAKKRGRMKSQLVREIFFKMLKNEGIQRDDE